MRREEGAQLLFSPQFAHDLRERQFGKNALGLQPQRQLRREEELGDFLATHFHVPYSIT